MIQAFQQYHCDLVYIGYASICHSVCLWCQRQKVYVCQYKTIPTLYMRTYIPDPLKTGEALAVIGSIVRIVAAQQSE